MPANIPYKPFCLELARGCLTIASLPRLVEAISPGTPQRGFLFSAKRYKNSSPAIYSRHFICKIKIFRIKNVNNCQVINKKLYDV
jgi:hypothetical protein